jgi:CubicO group peptidase (beta-lactamase class C family)
MKQFFLFIVSIFFLCRNVVFCQNYQADFSRDKSDKIDLLINRYCQNNQFNGVVLVSARGKIIYEKAFGIADRERNIPNTIDTKFKIASLSKAFTALLILQLAQSGDIRLNGIITDYIHDYKGKSGDSITIHQLLTHTSGILTSLAPEEEAVQERLHHDLREMVKYAESADLYFKSGTGFRYSNYGYSILACIIEKVTGKSFDAVLHEKILDPAGMFNTGQFDDTLTEDHIARGYEYRLLNGFENATYLDRSYCTGAGSLISTAKDLYLWDQALYSDKLIPGDYRIKMFTPDIHGNYGYGWYISRKEISSGEDSVLIADHAGSINGFGAYIARILTDSSLVVVLKNQREDTYIDPAYAPDIGQQIISVVYGGGVNLPKKSIAHHIAYLIGKKGIDSAIAEYYHVLKKEPENYLLDETELNRLGIELYFRYNKIDEALKVFEVNMKQFPKSYNTYDSYAYILMQKGDFKNAVLYYRKGLKVLKKYPEENDLKKVAKDAEKALVYIKEMEEKMNNKTIIKK